MKNKFISHLGGLYRRQRNSSYLQLKQFFKFFLCLITAMSITLYFTATVIPATKPYTTSWIGNTYGGGKKWVQNYVEGMYVGSDGTVYTNSTWDEAAREAGIYKDGDVIGPDFQLHGQSRVGGKAITVSDKYIYLAMVQGSVGKTSEDYPAEKTAWYCVRRYTLSGKPADFAGGRGYDKSMVIVSTKSPVTGLAVVGKELYVGIAEANRISVYNTDTMTEVRNFSVASPKQMTVDKQGNLWIIQSKNGSTPAQILHYSSKGKRMPEVIADVVDPSAIALDNQGRLLVAENGPRQQILIYKITGKPAKVGTFGVEKGVYAGVPGEIGNLKFYGISGVGTDAAGNLYVNSNGFNNSGTDLRKFSPSGKLQWRLLGLHFVDNADTDPQSDGVEVYTKHEYFQMDYKKPSGKQWSYNAYTLNPFKYPQDPRLHTSPTSVFFRRIQGKPFMYLIDMYDSFMQIYRFNPTTDGKIAIPSAMFFGTAVKDGKPVNSWPPNQPQQEKDWIWRDSNGNGAFDQGEYDIRDKDYPYGGGSWVDSKGDLWRTLRTQEGIRHYPLQGLDKKGNPIYSYSSMKKDKTPSPITDLRRIEYFPNTDTMYLSGFTKEHPPIGDDSGVVGSEIIRYDNWSKGSRTPRWRTVIPYDTTGKREVMTEAMSVAGDYVFAVTGRTSEVYVYKAATGKQVQKLKPGAEVAGESGWIDIPYGIRAFRRSNGEYLVFVEEDWKGKVIMYQLPR
ncbi:hypothetical protein HW132_25645 [Brasilonema sp. CT11]|nr:hypothetical protein [Brasilonema sp. CT11]